MHIYPLAARSTSSYFLFLKVFNKNVTLYIFECWVSTTFFLKSYSTDDPPIHPSIHPAPPAGAYYCWPWAVPSPSKCWHIETDNYIFKTLGNLKSQMNISSSSAIWNMCVYLHVENEKCWFHNHVKTNALATVCVDWWPCTEMISPVSPSQRHCPSLFLDNQPAGHTSTDHKSHLLYLPLTHCSITTE